jgi:hypothetical protein
LTSCWGRDRGAGVFDNLKLNKDDFLDLIAIVFLSLAVNTHRHVSQRHGKNLTQQNRAVSKFHRVLGHSTQFEANATSRELVGPHVERSVARGVAFFAEVERVRTDGEIDELGSYTRVFSVDFEIRSRRDRNDSEWDGFSS